MNFILSSLVLLATLACVLSQAQAQYQQDIFRNHPDPSFEILQSPNEARFFNKITLTLTTTTSTSTFTSTVTCTTSTSALSVCTPSARRRRGIALDSKKGRGLFYSENEENEEDGSIFLPSPKNVEEEPKVDIEPSRTARQSIHMVPFIVQPGYAAPAGNARFLVAYSTSTLTTTTTITSTSSLTAICSSTTGFQLCGSIGK